MSSVRLVTTVPWVLVIFTMPHIGMFALIQTSLTVPVVASVVCAFSQLNWPAATVMVSCPMIVLGLISADPVVLYVGDDKSMVSFIITTPPDTASSLAEIGW